MTGGGFGRFIYQYQELTLLLENSLHPAPPQRPLYMTTAPWQRIRTVFSTSCRIPEHIDLSLLAKVIGLLAHAPLSRSVQAPRRQQTFVQFVTGVAPRVPCQR